MTSICYPENRNSFTVDDYSTVVSNGSFFTSGAPVHRAPKKLVSFELSPLPELSGKDQSTPAQRYRAAIDSLFEHAMTKKEVAYFRREMASKFVPLTPEQTRLLPPRVK